MSNSTVDAVFTGAVNAVQGAHSVVNTVTDAIGSISQQFQQGYAGDSRRDMQMPLQMQQPMMYQSPQYPWANPQYVGYGFGAQQPVNAMGYPGISHPNYGRVAGAPTVHQFTRPSSIGSGNFSGWTSIWGGK